MPIENKLNLTFDSVCLVSPAFVHLLAHAAVFCFFYGTRKRETEVE